MDSSTTFQVPPQAAYFLWSCDKVYHKQKVCILLYFLGHIVSWQYNPNLLDLNRPFTVINDHDWQLWNCPLGWPVGPNFPTFPYVLYQKPFWTETVSLSVIVAFIVYIEIFKYEILYTNVRFCMLNYIAIIILNFIHIGQMLGNKKCSC